MNSRNNEDLNSISKFKQDIVNTWIQTEDKVNNRICAIEKWFDSKIIKYETQLQSLEHQVSEMSNNIIDLQLASNKLSQVIPIQDKHTESWLTTDIKLTSLSDDVRNAFFKYDKLIIENLNVPGIIGDYCKHKTIRDFLSFASTQIAGWNVFKDSIQSTVKVISAKHEKLFNSYNAKIDAIQISCENMVKSNNKFIEAEYKENIKEYLNKINETKLENSKYYIGLQDNSNKLQLEINKLTGIKQEITRENDLVKKEIFDGYDTWCDKFGNIKAEFGKINRHFHEIVDFIKDVRFKKNINTDVTKNDWKGLISNWEKTPSNYNMLQWQTTSGYQRIKYKMATEREHSNNPIKRLKTNNPGKRGVLNVPNNEIRRSWTKRNLSTIKQDDMIEQSYSEQINKSMRDEIKNTFNIQPIWWNTNDTMDNNATYNYKINIKSTTERKDGNADNLKNNVRISHIPSSIEQGKERLVNMETKVVEGKEIFVEKGNNINSDNNNNNKTSAIKAIAIVKPTTKISTGFKQISPVVETSTPTQKIPDNKSNITNTAKEKSKWPSINISMMKSISSENIYTSSKQIKSLGNVSTNYASAKRKKGALSTGKKKIPKIKSKKQLKPLWVVGNESSSQINNGINQNGNIRGGGFFCNVTIWQKNHTRNITKS